MKFKETYKPSTQPESSSGWQGFFPETELSVLSLNTLAEMADSGNEEAITAVINYYESDIPTWQSYLHRAKMAYGAICVRM